MANDSLLVNQLEPITQKEVKLLQEIVTSKVGQEVYRTIRSLESGQVSHGGLRELLQLPHRSSAQRAFESLVKRGLLTKSTQHGRVVWTVQPVLWPEEPVETFRGSLSISVAAYSPALPVELDEHEEAQLFLSFQSEPLVAALYRFCRARLRQETTKSEMAQVFCTSRDTIDRRLGKLEGADLIALAPEHSHLVVRYVDCQGGNARSAEEVSAWLSGPASVPNALTATRMLAASAKKDAPAALIQRFYSAAMTAVAHGSLSAMGRKATSLHVARNLSRNHSFAQLQGPLLFFVVDWNGENVERYGRTLQTFSKNLPMITEEYEDLIRGEPRYVIQTMQSYKLQNEFPTPAAPVKVGMSEKDRARFREFFGEVA